MLRHYPMIWLAIAFVTASAGSAMSVSLQPSTPSPAPLATVVTWSADITDASPGTLWYRFRAHRTDQPFHTIRDYGPIATLDWTAGDHEGMYEIEAAVRNLDTGETATSLAQFEMLSLVTGNSAVINPTSHPLVYLYSAPPCACGSRMMVRLQSPNNATIATPYKACADGLSMNFYLAGLQMNGAYSAQNFVATPSGVQAGPVIQLNGPNLGLDLNVPPETVAQSPPESAVDPIILHSSLDGTPTATDLLGNLLWFEPNYVSILTRPEPGGLFFGLVEDETADQSGQIVREFDLLGLTVAETNAARVNEQLAAMGKRQISAFHHEARALPDGKILALATVEQILTDVQGPGPIDVLGDMIIVMDSDLQVIWTWDAFDYLDPSRAAILGETCSAATAGCPPFYLADAANDWLHGNSVQLTPDGALLYSTRHQDWVIKIDYNNGAGSGDVLWRLGRDGDFTFNSSDSFPWFSHQHDPQYVPSLPSTLTVFDNNNTRNFLYPGSNSRGQVIQLDEQNRIATPLVNIDLGVYSAALGAAQLLTNGDYYFAAGDLPDASTLIQEFDPSFALVYALQSPAPEYRSFRMRDLYTPPY